MSSRQNMIRRDTPRTIGARFARQVHIINQPLSTQHSASALSDSHRCNRHSSNVQSMQNGPPVRRTRRQAGCQLRWWFCICSSILYRRGGNSCIWKTLCPAWLHAKNQAILFDLKRFIATCCRQFWLAMCGALRFVLSAVFLCRERRCDAAKGSVHDGLVMRTAGLDNLTTVTTWLPVQPQICRSKDIPRPAGVFTLEGFRCKKGGLIVCWG